MTTGSRRVATAGTRERPAFSSGAALRASAAIPPCRPTVMVWPRGRRKPRRPRNRSLRAARLAVRRRPPERILRRGRMPAAAPYHGITPSRHGALWHPPRGSVSRWATAAALPKCRPIDGSGYGAAAAAARWKGRRGMGCGARSAGPCWPCWRPVKRRRCDSRPGKGVAPAPGRCVARPPKCDSRCRSNGRSSLRDMAGSS